MLHPSKNQSILQWFNSMITKGAIQSLSQLADGFNFHDIITIINGLKKKEKPPVADVSSSDISVNDPDTSVLNTTHTEAESVKDESNTEEKISETEMVVDEAAPTSLKETETDVSVSEEEVKTDVNSNKAKNDAEIEKRFEAIKEFIDDFFGLDSSSIITYSECMKGKELELAKVAVLLLSALVQVFLSSNNEQLYTTTLLDLQVQEDIKECLALVLEASEEDGPLKKTELHRILSRPSKCKGTPRRRTPSRGTSEVLETPETSKSIPKKRKDRASVIHEEVFESPLKSLLESPKLQFKAAIFRKDAEIYKLRENLHAEETKVIDLTIEKRSLNDELEKKKRELEFLKEEHRKLQECAEEVDAHKRTELKDVLVEKERNNKIIHDMKEEMEVLKKENENLHTEIDDLKDKLSQKSNTNQVDYKQQCADLVEKVRELELNIDLKESKITELKQAAITRDRSLKEYKRIYDEKRQEDIKKKRKSISDVIPETASNIIYADQCLEPALKTECEALRNKLEEERQKVRKLENDLKRALNEEAKMSALNSKISDLRSDLDSSNKQLEMYKQLPKTTVNNGSILNLSDEVASGSLLALPTSLWRNASPDGSERDDRHWDTCSVKSIETRSRSASALGYHRDTDAEFHPLRKVARSIAKILVKKCNPAEAQQWSHLEEQARCLGSIRDICVFYQSLLDTLKSGKIVVLSSALDLPSKRKSRSQAGGEEIDPNVLYLHCKRQENELQAVHLEMSNLKKELKTKLEESKVSEDKYKELELHVKELSDKLEKSQQDVKDAKGKYEFTKKCVENLNTENKRLLKICMVLKDEAGPKAEPCKDCKIIREKLADVKQDRNDLEKDSVELKALVRDFECKNRNLERLLKNEIKEKKKLEFKIQRESAFLSGSMSDRNAVIQQYFQQGLAESKKAKIRADNEKKSQVLPQPQQVVSFNTYILNHETKDPCPESSMSSANTYANRSIRSGFLQTDDEEDFLNHSSLAQIHREVFPEPEADNRRLTEIQRRNTLCLPHLQSSYPLELQNMTPTEKKYFGNDFRAPVQPYRKGLMSAPDEGATSEFIIESEDSQDVQVPLVRKRKGPDLGRTSTQPMKKAANSSSRLVQRVKPITPVRKTGFISKTKSFKTPTSIRRLMRMPQKNKNQ